jgi:6-phosphofructokinase 1
MTLFKYGAKRVYGIQDGFKGVSDPKSWCELTPDFVKEINHRGGTILHSQRGNPPHIKMAEILREQRIRQLFVLGGNGAHKGILQLCQALAELEYECACVGVPSTIDNDMPMTDKTFGFDTACSVAKTIIDAAYVEATCNANCIGFVKLPGHESGSLTVMSVLATRHVDLCLIPEMTVSLDKVLDHCEAIMTTKGYGVIVISDGCGEKLFTAGDTPEDGDVGPWLKDKVLKRFKDRGKPLTIKYLDPTYMLRSQPANASDSVFCGMLAEHAVHGAMAGLTCFTTAKLYERYIYIPLNANTTRSKQVNPQGRWCMRMRFTTRQPAFEPDGFKYGSSEGNPQAIGGSLEDVSTEVPLEEVLLPGSTVTRFECASLGSTFPSKNLPNTVKSLSFTPIGDRTWSMQAVTQPNSSANEPRNYLQMLRSGPRSVLHFDVTEPGATAAIVTCGGLCPGLNDVIRELTIMLQTYGVQTVYGIIGGFKGCVNEDSWITLTEEYVQTIHMKGGTILVSDRGNPPHSEIAKALQKRNVRQYFVIGGDGSHKGAMQSFDAMTELGHECAVVGIPKTIDNDIMLVDRTFGYDTACEEARQAIDSGYVEATTNANCIGLVKLMGRHCGWIAAAASLASQHVDVCLIPEMDVSLDKLLSHIASVLKRQKYAVVVVAEGCGDTLISGTGATDAGGNKLLADVGTYLKDEIIGHCKSNRIPVSIKYIDPTYMIRAVPANASDSIYCSVLAQQAVHGAMAGYTGFCVGKVDERFVMLPIHSIVDKGSRKVGLTSTTYKRLVAATGQPNFSARSASKS